MTTTVRTRYVEDLAPGDRFAFNDLRAVVRKAVPNADDDFVIGLVNSSDDRTELVLPRGTKVEVQ